MKPARRLESLPIYVFASLTSRLKALQAQGLDIIRLDIGSPDGPPADFIIETLSRSAAEPGQHGYAGYFGTPALRQAFVDYYATRFGVALNVADEVLPLIGSKEGIANIALAWLDPGDLALAPDPGYPTYRMSATMAGADVHFMPLLEENGFLPDLAAIPDDVAARVRLMWLNYPNNPTGATAPLSFLEAAVDFCRQHDILLCHDGPYADVCFDGYRAPSLLSVPGAKDVAVEFNSLSKSHNMAGWRVGLAVGNPVAIQALLQVKSNVDSGIFLPVQDAAVAALAGQQEWLATRNAEYQSRRDLLYDLLVNDWGLHVARPIAGLYLWPRVPEGYTAAEFVERILLATGVSFTPGSAFGAHGEGYMRISVGQTTPRIVEAIERLRQFKF
ncbi:MAG: LL-diaminopimelate aminotransferase [Anaerolineae bacterium CG2_30_64_16]|nr:MAG: LL-diaminopimelate aminotransferase [Anaerolineae bacterium CG2_30_64_16]